MSGNGSENATSENDSCLDKFNTATYTAVAALRAGVGTFSALCCLAMILLITVYRRYTVFTQRLVLNLAIAAFIHSLSYPLTRVNYYSELQLIERYCYFGSFFNLFTSWVEVIALMCIVVHLFVGGLLNRPTHKFEPIFWVITYTLPLLWTWIPFINRSYGLSGAWCGIRVLDTNCNSFTFGKILQFTLWYIPLFLLLFITFVISIMVAIKVRRDTKSWVGLYDAKTKANQEKIKEIMPLLFFPAIYLVLNTFSFIDRLYSSAEPNDPEVGLTFLHTLTSPFRGAFVALVYVLVDPATRNRLRWRQIMVTFKNNTGGDIVIKEYPAIVEEVGDSISYVKYETPPP